MLRFVSDDSFNGDIVRGLLLRQQQGKRAEARELLAPIYS